jgi:hypothetical protein
MSGSSVCQPEGSEFEFYLRSHFLFTTKLSTFWLTERRRVLAEMANTRGMSHSHQTCGGQTAGTRVQPFAIST